MHEDKVLDFTTEKKAWREVKTQEKFLNAFRGLKVFWMTTSNLLTHTGVAFVVIVLGFYFKISGIEWIALVFAIGFVIIAEAFNTAIEIDIDLTSPEYHPYARDTKDVAAAAVLLSVFVSVIVGVIIFLPKIF
ncbi:MAG: diacylglycerol kinase family protein [Candidatus Paceibacterota bacterium]